MHADLLSAVVITIGAVMVAVLLVAARRSRSADAPHPVRSLLAAARRRAVLAVALAALLGFALLQLGAAVPSLLGLPFALATGLAATAGLLLYAATPPRVPRVDERAPRAASLESRSLWTHAPWHSLALPGALLALQLLLVLFCGATAGADEFGRSRVIRLPTEHGSTAAGPYPGWYYGLPALLVSALLVLALLVALRRIGGTAALPVPELSVVDAGWRRASVGILSTLVSAALAVPLGGTAFIAGSAMRSASGGVAPHEAWWVLGTALQLGGAALGLAGIVLLARAVALALRLPSDVVRAAEAVEA